jgi:hypothetical protein
MIIQNKKIIDFFLKHNINHEEILLKWIDMVEQVIVKNTNTIDYNMLLESFTNNIDTKIQQNMSELSSRVIKIDDSFTQYMNYTKISSNKGKVKENTYFNLMTQRFPEYEIENCSQNPNSMDILLLIDNVEIRIDIKDYASNIPLKEINKFHSDILNKKSHGILISDNSGISNKENFTFDLIQNKYIAFYISNNNLNMDYLKNAISFIKTIDKFIIPSNDNVFYSKEVFEKISLLLNKYYVNISELKDKLHDCMSITNKLTIDNISSLLNISLNSTELLQVYTCDSCDIVFDTKRKLLNHAKKIHIDT